MRYYAIIGDKKFRVKELNKVIGLARTGNFVEVWEKGGFPTLDVAEYKRYNLIATMTSGRWFWKRKVGYYFYKH